MSTQKRIKIVAHSKGLKEDCLLYQRNADLNPVIIENNTLPIAEAYNKQLDQAKADGTDILVLCHDDIMIYSDVITQLEYWSKHYDLIGVTGSSGIDIKTPVTWINLGRNAMKSGKSKVHCLHGQVAHGKPEWQNIDSYGPFPSPVLVIDGLFMALTRPVIETLRFDESCPSKFDFYDLDFSLQTIVNSLRVGVVDIHILHESTGSYGNNDYKEGETWFQNKWGPIFNQTDD